MDRPNRLQDPATRLDNTSPLAAAMRSVWARLLFALLASGVSSVAVPEELAPIIVTAPDERTGDVAIGDHAGTHSRIGGDRLERRDISLDDILAQEAGVQRRRSGGFGSFASITVRAASPAQTTVLLDGVRLNSAGNPVVDLSLLESLSLASIDVYRSVTPLQFGSSSIGGAVNLVTPRVDNAKNVTRWGAGIASFGTTRADVTHRGRHGRWDTVAALSLADSRNDFPFDNDNGTPLNANDDRREHRNNAQAQRIGLLTKIGTEHATDTRSDVLVQLGERRLGVPEFRNNPDNDARFDTGTRQLQVSHSRPLSTNWSTLQTLFLNAEDDRFSDRDSDVGLGAQDTKSATRSTGIDSFWSRTLETGMLDFKVELRRESLQSRDRLRDTGDVDARRHSLSLNAQWTRYALDGRLVLSPSLRILSINDRLAAGNATDDTLSRDNTTALPGIGLRFDAGDALILHASLERSRREPSFAELFIDRGLVLGNPDLIAERGLNADIGLRWSATRNVELSATLFSSTRRELIVRTFDARGVGHAINTGRARVLGVELSSSWAPATAWRLQGNVTLQDAANVSDNPVLDDKQLPGEAQVQLHASARYQARERWQLRVDVDSTRQRYYDQANKRTARDSVALNAGIEYERGPWRTAFAIDNLGDDNVEDFNGFPRPGRAISLHVSRSL